MCVRRQKQSVSTNKYHNIISSNNSNTEQRIITSQSWLKSTCGTHHCRHYRLLLDTKQQQQTTDVSTLMDIHIAAWPFLITKHDTAAGNIISKMSCFVSLGGTLNLSINQSISVAYAVAKPWISACLPGCHSCPDILVTQKGYPDALFISMHTRKSLLTGTGTSEGP